MFEFAKKLYRITKEYDELKIKIEELEVNVSNLKDDNRMLKRIIEYGRENKITFKRDYQFVNGCSHISDISYIYKDGKEYKIVDLRLWNPVFFNTSDSYSVIAKDIIKSDDSKIEMEYAIDLMKRTYVILKNNKIDMKEGENGHK